MVVGRGVRLVNGFLPSSLIITYWGWASQEWVVCESRIDLDGAMGG